MLLTTGSLQSLGKLLNVTGIARFRSSLLRVSAIACVIAPAGMAVSKALSLKG
jgi:hypothetical protein